MLKRKADILVVDDQLGVRTLLRTALSEKKYIVYTASNGEEAVQMAKDLEPVLIIMDIKMPVMDGITALYEIKDIYPDMNIIMMTAYEEANIIEKIRGGGIANFFPKPFDLEFLISYVGRFFEDKKESLG